MRLCQRRVIPAVFWDEYEDLLSSKRQPDRLAEPDELEDDEDED